LGLLSSSLKVFICIWALKGRAALDYGRGSMACHAMAISQSFEVFLFISVFNLSFLDSKGEWWPGAWAHNWSGLLVFFLYKRIKN
jgi:hypothetical protein